MKKPLVFLCCLLWVRADVSGYDAGGYVIEWGYDMNSATSLLVRVTLTNAVDVSAGPSHSLAVLSDGTAFGWGGNYWGEATGVRTTNAPYVAAGRVVIDDGCVSNLTRVAAGRLFSLALREDGTICAWGENYVPPGLTSIAALAVDDSHSWVLSSKGTVVGWWRERSASYGLLAVDELSNITGFDVGSAPQGGTRGVAVTEHRTVRRWGQQSIYNDATPPFGLSNVVAVAAGRGHTLALKDDGTVVGWGFNGFGQATGTPSHDEPAVTSGPVILADGLLNHVRAIDAANTYSVALLSSGTIKAWGRMADGLRPAVVPVGLSNVMAIAAGDRVCLAITTNKNVASHFFSSHTIWEAK